MKTKCFQIFYFIYFVHFCFNNSNSGYIKYWKEQNPMIMFSSMIWKVSEYLVLERMQENLTILRS